MNLGEEVTSGYAVVWWCTLRTVDSDGVVRLVGAILRGTPSLPRPLAHTVESKYRRGFLSAVSVGLDFVDSAGCPLNWWSLTPEQIRDEAFYDLAELSAVTVPADPKAVVENSRQGLAQVGRELVELFDEKQRPNSSDAAAILRAFDGAETPSWREELVSRLTVHVLAADAIRRARREFVEECRRLEAEPWARPR